MKQRNIYWKMISVLLAVALAIQIIPLDCLATSIEDIENEIEVEEMSDIDNEKFEKTDSSKDEALIISEVDDLREERVKHFLTDDGSYIAASYLEPIHFEVDDELEDIDNSLIFSKDTFAEIDVFGYSPLQSPLDVFFAEESGKGDTVYFSEKGYLISWSFLSEQDENSKRPSMNEEENRDMSIDNTSGDIKENTIHSEESEDDMDEAESEPDHVEDITVEEKEEQILNLSEIDNVEAYEDNESSKIVSETEETSETAGEASSSPETKEDTDGQLETNLEAGTILEDKENDDTSNDLVSAKAEVVELKTFDKLEGNERFLSLPNLSSALCYRNIGQSVDLEYFLNSVYLKENIILNDRDADTSFLIRYHLGDLYAKVISEQEVAFVNEVGEVIFSINAPYMEDADGNVSENVKLEVVSEEKGELVLSLSVEESWLQEENRAYPVRIDPYINTAVESHDQDATALYQNASYPYGTLCIGNDNGNAYGKAKGYIRYTLPQLSAGDIITGGYLNIAQYTGTRGYSHVGNSSMRINAYKVTSSWTETSVRTSRGYNGLPSNESTILDYETVSQTSEYKWTSFEISKTVKEWYEGEDNFGICLRADDQNAWATSQFITSNNPSFT
ncbi:MAG: DNRLRE domain-containing protein, partial [Dorea sp.]|nr:DNRLRE domain-containing protein [Dorea sp.]